MCPQQDDQVTSLRKDEGAVAKEYNGGTMAVDPSSVVERDLRIGPVRV